MPAYGNPTLSAEAADLALRPNGDGYWISNTAGGIYAYGNAGYHHRSGPGSRQAPASSHPTPSGNGYWVPAGNGDVLGYGDAPALGGVRMQPVDVRGTTTGQGYWVLLADGQVSPSATPAIAAISPTSACSGRRRQGLLGMPSAAAT